MSARVQGASSLHVKLAQVRGALNGQIRKTGENKHFKYNFVEATTIGRQFVAAMSEVGLTMLPISMVEGEVGETISGKEWIRSVVVTWRITDSETGEYIDVMSAGQGSDPGDKGLPKAQTNAMKYAILLVLQAAGDDPEADSTTTEPGGETQRSGNTRLSTGRGNPRGRGTAVAAPADDGEVSRAKSLASNAFKSKIRAHAREAGLDDDALKAFAAQITGKESSKEWTERDAEKVLNRIQRADLVETFLDERDMDKAIATVSEEAAQ